MKLKKEKFMDINHKIDTILASPISYWEDGSQDWRAYKPSGGTLPDLREASQLIEMGKAAYELLLEIVTKEETDNLRFKNSLFFLMYFDSLFIYRNLKKIYLGEASSSQQSWLAEALRKIIIRSRGWYQFSDEDTRRTISKNTRPGRLSTTPMIVELASEISRVNNKAVVIRDMAVSDGTTSLDLAVAAAEKKVPISIMATDASLYLYFSEVEDNKVVFNSNGHPLQYEISGKIFQKRDNIPDCYKTVKGKLDKKFNRKNLDMISTITPEVELVANSNKYNISFKEEDLFSPALDIKKADVIRIANLLVEITDDHKGYFFRDEIIKAISGLGNHVKDGAYLVLNNFRKKIEYIGVWRKDASLNTWIRLPASDGINDDLEGVANIDITEGIQENKRNNK
jgi:hypothetical protein